MEKGKIYVFYNNWKKKYFVGKFLATNNDGSYAFDVNGEVAFGSPHDELNPQDNVYDFIEYVAEKFQNKFQRNVSVLHEDYEFKISIPRGPCFSVDLSDIEFIMNNILEDWWSVQWCELEYNTIHCNISSVEVSFRVHEAHEVQFKYNEEVK